MKHEDMTGPFDAIVIGSGITGGWAAKEFTEKGLRVLMLERGKPIEHRKDYVGELNEPWETPFYGKQPRDLYDSDYAVQQLCYAFDENTRQYWNNDRENPYIRDEEKPFDWIRTDVVGGRSLTWGRQCYRWYEEDFRANEKDGHGTAWPIGYDDVAPWYDYVEDFIGVSGQAEGLPQLPDGVFQKPMEMFTIEKTVKERVEKRMPNIKITMGRTATLTEPKGDREACHYCGLCHRGCSTGSYFSTQSSTLPAARKTGKLTLRPHSVVDRLEIDTETGKVSSVSVIDSQTMQRHSFSAPIVFLCASTVGSTQILMNSKSDAHPNGLGNSSGALGHYLMDHTYGVSAMGVFADNLDRYYYGNRANNVYVPRFRNVMDQDQDADFVRGYGYQGFGLRTDWRMLANLKGFGAAYKERLRKPGPWAFGMGGFGECLPYHRNKMKFHETKTDRFGMPLVEFDFEWGENEIKARKDMAKQADKMMKAAGAVFIITDDSMSIPGRGIHEMGTARMGHSRKDSVLNKWNQLHDVPNLFVTDGSCMTSASCVNPSLTYMALTARAVDYAVKQFKQGTL